MLDIIKKNDSKSIELVMKECDGKSVPVFEFPLIEKKCGNMVEHCFSTRLGGVSEGIYESMNLSFTRGDEPEKVYSNFKIMSCVLNGKVEDIVCSNQTHTTNVIEITKEHAGNGVVRENAFNDVDGMVTNVPGIILATFYADCVPLYFIDKKMLV